MTCYYIYCEGDKEPIAHTQSKPELLEVLEKALAWYETKNAPISMGIRWAAEARASIDRAASE